MNKKTKGDIMKKIVLLAGGRESTGYKEYGRLASAIFEYFECVDDFDVIPYTEKSLLENKDSVVAIVFTEKDGCRLNDIVESAYLLGVPVVNLATGIDSIMVFDNHLIVEAPNIDIAVLKKINQIAKDTQFYISSPDGGYIAFITEAHQASKKSLPGTAKVLQEILGDICHPQIASVRSPRVAMMLGIPKEALGGFGYHRVEIFEKKHLEAGGKAEYKRDFYVDGRKSYAKGLEKLLRVIPKLEKRNYHINEIVEKGIL